MRRNPSDPRLPTVAEAPTGPVPASPPPETVPDTAGVWTAHDPVTRAFLADLYQAAAQDAPVYVHGEPGSGRRCAARTLCRWRQALRGDGRASTDGRRLPVLTLRVPSLRERPLDLPEIAERWLGQLARESGGTIHGLTPRALEALLARQWRGNFTELHAVLTAAAQRAGGRALLDAGDLPMGAEPALRPSQIAKDEAQRDCLLRQLRVARSVSAAAKLEGCSRANYIRLMRRLGIRRADCGGGAVMPAGPVGIPARRGHTKPPGTGAGALYRGPPAAARRNTPLPFPSPLAGNSGILADRSR